MSLWHCKEHGLVGPEACCPQASRASISEISASGPPEPPTLMSEEARAEIEEFRGHLIEHVGTTAAGCRFCAARDALAARRWNVLLYIAAQGERGATADEVEQAFGLGHNATSPRVTELLSMGYLERLTTRRKTRQGSSAFVHVVSEMGRQALVTKRAA